VREWFENEAFWREMFPYMFDENRFAQAEEQVRKIMKLTGIRRGAVLDLCCGPGRHSVILAKRGFQVTGVDRTRFLLSKARRHAKSARARVEFIRSDMREFVRPDAYKLALNLWTSFGYFDDKDEDRLVLRNLFSSLKKGGACLIDVFGKERMAKTVQPFHTSRHSDGTLLVEVHEIVDDWTRIRNEWILIKDNRAKRFKFHQNVYSGTELKDLMLNAGFDEVKLFGDFDGRPYDLDAPRLVAVGRKR
jgi:ubiquinone/menaquinone biosynthesis C-methylase UbiE